MPVAATVRQGDHKCDRCNKAVRGNLFQVSIKIDVVGGRVKGSVPSLTGRSTTVTHSELCSQCYAELGRLIDRFITGARRVP